jgi:hypothetical protein
MAENLNQTVIDMLEDLAYIELENDLYEHSAE